MRELGPELPLSWKHSMCWLVLTSWWASGGGGGSDVNQSEVKERMGFLCSSHSHFISDIFVPLYFKNDPGQVETLTRFHIVLQARITFCVCFSFFFKFMKHVSK